MDLGGGTEAKIKLFQNVVMLAKYGSKYFAHRHTLDPGGGVKRSYYTLSKSSRVAYQIKADDAGSNMVANILPTDTLLTKGVESKGQTISFTENSHVAYQIKGN